MVGVDTLAPVAGDADVLERLQAQIEGLCDSRPMFSKSALTHRRSEHVQFINGAQCASGEDCIPNGGRSTEELCLATFIAVRSYFLTFRGPVNLVWRVEPMIEDRPDGKHIYTRLCFEPSLVQVSKDVWISARIA